MLASMKIEYHCFYKLIIFMSILSTISCNSKDKSSESLWWKESVFYEIYMPSYADGNGDGYGDFRGMILKLDYLQSLGIKGIWLTPFLQSPKVDNGYDVSSYYDVDSTYGTNNDFKEYLDEAHRRGIKVIMDMVLNHSSSECKWFQESRKSKDNPYRDYYIWRDKPNNWESFFGGTAWELDTITNQYYYHKFDKRMPDLNWANPKLANEMHNVLRYWLNLGVDGFRFDVINFLNTNGILEDNPLEEGNQHHKYDIDQQNIKETIKQIKKIVNEFDDRFIVGEIGSDKIEVLKQYHSPELLDVVFNFNFGSIPEFSGQRIYDELKSMENNLSGYPTLFFGSHDMPRLIDRLANGNPDRAFALAAIMLTAKGVPFVYYGEEIGMHNILAQNYTEIQDIQGKTNYQLALSSGKEPSEALVEGNKHNRDKSRSPMQWNSDAFAGFSLSNSWIKLNPDYKTNNVAIQSKDDHSLLAGYKALISLRNREKILQYGKYDQLEYNQDLLTFTRSFNGDKITVVINFGDQKEILLPAAAKILIGKVPLLKNQFVIYKH